MKQIFYRIYISILFIIISLSVYSQTDTDNTHIGLGFHFGYNSSNMRFIPADKENSPDYGKVSGYSGGLIVNIMAEKYAGVQVEANLTNKGWQEAIDSAYNYKRNMSYLEIPILTHISLGKKRFRYVFNLGPYMAFHWKSTETYEPLNENWDLANRYSINPLGSYEIKQTEFPDAYGDSKSSAGLPIDSKFDLGFIFDAAFGVSTSIGIIQIKARYSQGVINVFDKYPKSIYRYSQTRNVYFGVSYYYNFYFKKDS